MDTTQLSMLAGRLRLAFDARTGNRRTGSLVRFKPDAQKAEGSQHAWMTIARNVEALGAPEAQFMDAVFLAAETQKTTSLNPFSRHGNAPRINQLMNMDRCRYIWEDYISRTANCAIADSETPADVEWRLIVKLSGNYLLVKTGSVDPLNPAVLEILRDDFHDLPAIFRCVYSNCDPVVIARFGDEARRYLHARESVAQIIRAQGLPLPPNP